MLVAGALLKKIPVIGKRETFLFDFELLTAWNSLERDRIPAGLARDGSLKGVKLANSELHQSGTKYGLTSKSGILVVYGFALVFALAPISPMFCH